jgi:hypothetical protein
VLCPPVLLLSFAIDRSHNLLQQRGCLRSLVLSYEAEEGKEGGGEGGCGGRGEGLSEKMVVRDRGSLSLPSFKRAVRRKTEGKDEDDETEGGMEGGWEGGGKGR